LFCTAFGRFLARRAAGTGRFFVVDGVQRRMAAKSRAISSLVSATAKPLFLGLEGGSGGAAGYGDWTGAFPSDLAAERSGRRLRGRCGREEEQPGGGGSCCGVSSLPLVDGDVDADA
jgi:hypothetical protein